ncbi:HNH endonuclease [Bradyrhizobium sp. STM 3557]|uniref:HNH endonuclease n=1 Tax=Bradyrhizobium sp. STM 3557 TaxID=578920 RepID=UPI00389006D0
MAAGSRWHAMARHHPSERQQIWCLVDAIDYPWLVETNWNVWWSGRARWQLYAKRNVGRDRATVRMHREILKAVDPRPAFEIAALHGDHRNGQTLDNRRANLRWLTPAENRLNVHERERIPSLDLIVLQLKARERPRLEALEAIPF